VKEPIMQPFHDDFDARLAAAVSPLITHPVSDEDVRAGDLLQRHAAPSLAPVAAVVAVCALGAAVVAGPRLVGLGSAIPQSPTTSSEDASLAGVPHVQTTDGIALVERKGDSIRLVLRRDTGESVVLASLVEAAPSAQDSYISGHIVECPASTGLTQRYYNFGQANHVSSPKMTFDGITAVGEYRNGLYVVAITSDPTVSEWRTWLGPKGGKGTGGSAESFAKLPSYGAVSGAGCYYSAE
jgi:hypothetical protein